MSTIKQENSEESLPFSIPKQEALLGYLLTDSKFFLTARAKIQVTWWSNSRHSQIWDLALKLAERYNRAVTPQEVSDCQSLVAMDPQEANKIRSVINICLARRAEYGLDMLQSDLSDWLKCRIYLAGMKKSENLFNMAAKGGGQNSQLASAFEELKKIARDIDDASFEPGRVETFDISDIEAQREDIKNAVDFGLPKLNALLAPEGQGYVGLLRGDMTVLLAPSNVGKTSTMVTIAVCNILAERDVLLITHEGRISDIKLKIWQCMMEETRENLLHNLESPKFKEALLECQAKLTKHLEFLPLNKAALTVEEVDAIIRRRQERWQSVHFGKGFDLIIDDYAAKLTTSQAKGGNFQLRQIHEVVYNYFSQIALEHNVHVITAIQTNREGSKINNRVTKGGAESRFLTMEDVMESWGPMTTATNVISINRPPEAKARNVTGFYLCKSRSSETGVVFLAQSKFSCTRSHWPTWQCEEYSMGSSSGDRIQALLADFDDVELPETQNMTQTHAITA